MAALTEIKENETLVYENRKVEINNFEVEDELPSVFTIESCLELILQSLHNNALELSRRSTTLTTENCNVERNGRLGRPTFYVQHEMLEDLLNWDFLNRKLR